MSDIRNQQEVTVSLMDDSLHIFVAPEQMEADVTGVLDPGCLIQNRDNDSASESYKSCYSGESSYTVARTPGNLTNEIEEFISGVQQCSKNINGKELQEDEVNGYRQIFPAWNTFLESEQGIRGTSAIISWEIKGDINKFIPWQEELAGTQWTKEKKKWITTWLPQWNMFLQVRAGETLVTYLNVYLTIVGFIFYIVDLVSDIGTAMYFASIGYWDLSIVLLVLVYGAVIIHTAVKWLNGQIHFTSSADWLRYVGSLIVNWPDVKLYGALCLLEWKMYKSPVNSARLVPEWHQRRANVALLKFTEGLCEACPQAIVQLCLLPSMYVELTWAEYLRIGSVLVSMCSAGAALVNREKYNRILDCTDLPPHELVVLHMWAVPVTVSRLLSVTLFLQIHPMWTVIGLALHLILRSVYYHGTDGVLRARIIAMCLTSLQFFISPFDVGVSFTFRRVFHAIHLLGNTVVTVVWASYWYTRIAYLQTVKYTVTICFIAVMFAVGLFGMKQHEKYRRRLHNISTRDRSTQTLQHTL